MNHLNNITNADLTELKKKYQGESLDNVINKINNGYPVQYAIGNVNFCGFKITVNESVLIPRFETEFLVELMLKIIPNSYDKKIIDIGTGSGCIAITLAKKLVNSTIIGIDISKDAINTANINKKLNNVDNLKFINKDLFQINNFNDYEIIVSNPPYVSFNEEVGLETKYEPQNAIFAKDNGLIFYDEILKKVAISKNVKHVFFEIGMNQANDIYSIMQKYIPEYKMDVYKDLANKDRYVHIYLNK